MYLVSTKEIVYFTTVEAKKLCDICNNNGISCKIDNSNKTHVVFDDADIYTGEYYSEGYTLTISITNNVCSD